MKSERGVFLSIIFIVICVPLFGQHKVSVKDSLQSLLKSVKDTTRVIVLNKLSFQYVSRSNYDTARLYAQQALDDANRLSYTRGKARALVNMGNALQLRSLFDSARVCYLSGLISASEIGDSLVASFCYNNLGEVNRHLANYEEALSYYLKSAKASNRMDNAVGEAESYNNVGIVYADMNNIAKAREYYEMALKVSKQSGNQYDISTNILNLGNLEYNAGDYEKSLAYFNEAIAIKKIIDDKRGIGLCLNGIGNAFSKKNNLELALNSYQQALELGNAIRDNRVIRSSLNNMAQIYFLKHDYDRSLDFQKRFLAMAIADGTKADERIAYINLAQLYSRKNDFKTAFTYQDRYAVLNDSLFNIDSSRSMAQMTARYETEKKQHELDVLRIENQLQANIYQRQKLLFGGAGIIILLAALVLYFRSQVIRQKNIRLLEKVDAQSREMATIAMLVTKKNKAFNSLKEKLEGTLKDPDEYSRTIKSAVKDIDQEIDFDSDWDTFKYHFEKVHPDFFTKLTGMAPSLGITELRLCAYLRANLSTKEIAKLTNTTIRSVQQAKYRINLKLGPRSGSNLGKFLSEL